MSDKSSEENLQDLPPKFKVPKTVAKPARTPTATKLEALDENTALYTAEQGDPLAVSKDGYVHQDLLNYPTKAPSAQISHLSYFCPGLHGPGTKSDIARKCFEDLLQGEQRYIIPIIQRRYCWDNNLIQRWYDDVRMGKRDHLGTHNTGNLVIKYSPPDKAYILIDGQQRITTTLLLLSAIRDEIKADQLNTEDAEKLLKRIRPFLHLEDGKERLVACFLDREPFLSIINSSSSATSIPSVQTTAYEIFRKNIHYDVSKASGNQARADLYSRIIIECTRRMGVTRVKIENEIDMAQVFLWLQEKSFGVSFLFADSWQGECLACCDLTRNLLLAPLLNLPLQIQETFYFDHWLTGLEQKFDSRDHFNAILKRFIAERRPHVVSPSAFETQFTKAFGNKRGSEDAFEELFEYSKFTTVMEEIESRSTARRQHAQDTVQEKLDLCKIIIAEINQFVLAESSKK